MSQVSCRMKNGVWFPSTIQPSALETFIYALQLRIMHLSLPLLVSFLALFEHVVRLPSQCSKTAVRCELYVIKIWCRLGKFRDAAHPHVLIICCCGITWVRPPVSEDSQSQQKCIACAAAVASLEETRNGYDTGWKSVSLSASRVPQTFFTLCSGKILWIRITSSYDPHHRITRI